MKWFLWQEEGEAIKRARRAAADRILALQTADGALPMGKGATRLVPYFANLGALGLVAAARVESERAGFLRQAARRWVLWYDAHRNPDGTVYDYEGQPGGKWKPTGKYDSTDSYAATYLELLDALPRSSSDRTWLRERYPMVRRSVEALRLTLQKNGLITATPAWPVIYTMDNVEVLRGLRAAVSLARSLGEVADIRSWSAMADRTAVAIARDLWDAKNDCYLVGLQTDGGRMAGGSDKWYPEVMANLMAIGWLPADAPSAKRHRALYERLRSSTADSPTAGIPEAGGSDGGRLERFVWWGYAARTMGDTRRLDGIRQGIAAALLASPSAGAGNPATLGHAIRLLAEDVTA